MNLKLLIDGIVQQTTVLIAQLSTASGVRAPLAHVADQVFLELAREIEAQGVRRQVVADMFGLALRSYTKKMSRLTESASARDRTLWEAVLEFIGENTPSRQRVMSRFKADGEREVTAVLRDLKRSGLIHVTGSGDASVYGVTTEEVRNNLARQHDVDSIANLIWLMVFRGEAQTRDQLQGMLKLDDALLNDAIANLLALARLRYEGDELRASNFVVPFGAEQGWESAVLDHFRTVTAAIAGKVRRGRSNSQLDDRIGGSTFTFTLHGEHPHAERVYSLLQDLRSQVQELWETVSAHNEQHPPNPDDTVKVSFYLGQALEVRENDQDR